jgi:hypothetical protein
MVRVHFLGPRHFSPDGGEALAHESLPTKRSLFIQPFHSLSEAETVSLR